jgi:hypothetical protein
MKSLQSKWQRTDGGVRELGIVNTAPRLLLTALMLSSALLVSACATQPDDDSSGIASQATTVTAEDTTADSSGAAPETGPEKVVMNPFGATTQRIPGGSYTDSCWDIFWNNSTRKLCATCDTGHNSAIRSCMFNACDLVNNCHGVLNCGGC